MPDSSSTVQKIFDTWVEKINSGDEDIVDQYLASVVSKQEQGKSGLKEVFAPHQLVCCVLSFPYSSQKGHYELTKEVISQECQGIITSENAIRNFAKASVLPDLVHFKDIEYHAQSQAKADGTLVNPNGEKDRDEFVKFLQDRLEELDEAIQNKNTQAIFYYSGVLFHAIQDLACHQGMTNPEHAYRNLKRQSPDLNLACYKFAQLVQQEFVKRFLKNRLEKVTDELNRSPRIVWKDFVKVKDFIELYPQIREFNQSALNAVGQSHIARWFFWQHSHDNQEALQKIEETIFAKLAETS